MAEPVRVLSERPPETVSYRPVSGLAIAALIIAALYAVVVGGVGIVAFASGTPFFLPIWMFIIPAASFVLAVIAGRQIRTAEGTRSGQGLVAWAWWLSVLFGVGYGAFYGFTVLAVWLQADADIHRYFFDKIRAGKVDEAFQFTIDPEERDAASRIQEMRIRFGQAEGGKKSPLARFREHEIVQVIRQGGSDTNIKSLGLKDWEYKDKGYTVHQVYRITTPEGVFDIALGVRSRESREFKGRRWQLLLAPSTTYVVSRQKTDYGSKLDAWRFDALGFGARWMRRQQEGDLIGLFLGTLEPPERARLERQCLSSQLAASLSVAGGAMSQVGQTLAATSFLVFLNPELGCRLYLPGFSEFTAGNLVDSQDFEATKKAKEPMLKEIKTWFLQSKTVGMRPQDDQGILERLETEPHRVQVNFNVELAIFEPNNPATPKYRGQAALVLESDQDPMTSENVRPQWRVVKLKLLAGGTQSSAGAGPMAGR
jgi:hypothetical protein